MLSQYHDRGRKICRTGCENVKSHVDRDSQGLIKGTI